MVKALECGVMPPHSKTSHFPEGLKPAEIRAILEIAREHRVFLIEAWNEFDQRKS
jgi:hypothetical protein